MARESVEPRVFKGSAVCPCGELMDPHVGRRLDSKDEWLWWTCSKGHITCVLPLPEEFRNRPPQV